MTIGKHFKKSDKRLAKFSRIGSLIANKITPICQQNGFIQARILLEWEYIVTPQFAQLCTPVKVTFPIKQRHNGRLVLRTTSSMATELAYLEPQIINRINQFFGYEAIQKITLQQGPISPRSPNKKKNQDRKCETTYAMIKDKVQNIDDDRLREALLSLGMGIAQEKTES
jgi:hypothetical protein